MNSNFNNEGQGAIEYLLIIGAAIIVVAIVILLIVNVVDLTSESGDEAKGGVQSGFDSFVDQIQGTITLFRLNDTEDSFSLMFDNKQFIINKKADGSWESGNINESKLIDVVNQILVSEGKLRVSENSIRYSDHPCKGNKNGFFMYHRVYGCISEKTFNSIN